MAVDLITDENFETSLEQNQKVIVKYFAGWCGSCRLFAPKFKRLSGDDRFTEVTFLDVNAEHSPEARKKAGVTNLPYFATFVNGELVDGRATNKEDAVVEMIENIK